jgi:hypothetical protein
MSGVTQAGYCEVHGGYLFSEKCQRCALEQAIELEKRRLEIMMKSPTIIVKPDLPAPSLRS